MKRNNLSKLETAQKRVKDIKGFYNHAVIYLLINIILLIFKEKFIVTLVSRKAIGDPDFLRWIDWNIYGTPILWGIVLLIHGFFVFKSSSKFLKNWEDRKIEKYMREEE